MHVSYNNLWKLLIDKRMSKSELRDVMNMRSKTAAKKDGERRNCVYRSNYAKKRIRRKRRNG